MLASDYDEHEHSYPSPSSSQPVTALVPLNYQNTPEPHPDWHPILQDSRSIVLYNPTSHALTIRPSVQRDSSEPPIRAHSCPYCHRPLDDTESDVSASGEGSRAADYFRLLEIANETSSRPSTPPLHDEGPSSQSTFRPEAMAQGYFSAFFQEECRLGIGANGSVYLCQHVLDGNPLGHFAIKKIAVGESHSYLLQTLREVRLLETLRHPNIITYHHAWLEACQFSPFGPKIPTLHVLMQWAEGGSLDDFIDARLGKPSHPAHDPTTPTAPESDPQSKSARIAAFRKAQAQKASGEIPHRRRSELTAIHLMSAEEVRSLFGDITEGLNFLHDKSILHLDLKPGNVLLTWDNNAMIPRAMLSDFGTSRDMLHSSRRSGNTGTLEYTAPESLPSPKTGLLSSVDSKADMWSLGMILHRMLFFCLPYYNSSDSTSPRPLGDSGEMGKMNRLEKEVLNYSGFKYTQTQATAFATRRLPRSYLILLENLLSPKASARSSCERVANAIREGKFDPEFGPAPAHALAQTSLVPSIRKGSGLAAPHASASPELGSPKIETLQTPISPTERPIIPAIPLPEKRKLKTPSPPPRRLSQKNVYGTLTIRLVKSCILVAKILSLQPVLADSDWQFTFTSALLILLAVLDTIWNGDPRVYREHDFLEPCCAGIGAVMMTLTGVTRYRAMQCRVRLHMEQNVDWYTCQLMTPIE